MISDLTLDELEKYCPPRQEPPDFDQFWQETLSAARQSPLDPRFEPFQEETYRLLDVFDVTYRGFGGQPIKGWLLLPKTRSGKLPCVVEYIGYGGGRGYPADWLFWSNAGYAHLVMDTRGQGSSWLNGDTPDPELEGSNPHSPGFMTRGILSPATYYYRRVFTDAVRAIETARTHPAVDAAHVVVTGVSQGGGISLAMTALVPDLFAAMPDVPYLCHMRRAVDITDAQPYQEIARYCRVHRDKIETVFNTLSYFDGMNFASRAKCQALFSTALMDEICPPSTVFAAYHHYAGPRQIKVWPFNGHEGGETYQDLEKLKFLNALLA